MSPYPALVRAILYTLNILFFCYCSTNKAATTRPPATINPTYPPAVESRISNVINNLRAKTPVDSVFERKSLSEQMKRYGIPGVSIALINDGKVEWARGFGITDSITRTPVGINTLFQAASISKPVFALAVMQLRAKGILDLDKDVNEYLRSWKVPGQGGSQPVVTLRQLLSHTAGASLNGFPGYSRKDVLPGVPEILSGSPPANTAAVVLDTLPGTKFNYSGGGFTIAQLAVVDHVNKPFPEIMNDEILAPLKLKYSTFHHPLPEHLEKLAATGYQKGKPISGKYHVYPEMAAAGLWSNPTELAAILIEVQKGVKGQSGLLKKETMDEMFTPQPIAKFIGVGFFLEKKGNSVRLNHNGWNEGFVAHVRAFKDIGKGFVIMTNADEGLSLVNQVMNAVALEYQWTDYTLR